MRLHDVVVSRRGVSIDGLKVVCEQSGPTARECAPGVWLVWVPLFASRVVLAGDVHDPDAGCPVYDRLCAEVGCG